MINTFSFFFLSFFLSLPNDASQVSVSTEMQSGNLRAKFRTEGRSNKNCD